MRESLRLYPPATLLNRRVKAGGFALTPDITVPEGEGVFPFLYAYQRSPEYWPAAEEYRPERWLPEGAHLAPTTPDAWTPFGRCAGVQDCTHRMQPGVAYGLCLSSKQCDHIKSGRDLVCSLMLLSCMQSSSGLKLWVAACPSAVVPGCASVLDLLCR